MVVAISVSIVAGWAVLADMLPRAIPNLWVVSEAKCLVGMALPFGMLQITQVLALDGDIFLAKAVMPAEDAGLVAALSLFQRIQFFACFSLAGVLLPRVIAALREGENVLRCALPVFSLVLAVGIAVGGAALLSPETMIALLAGDADAALIDGVTLRLAQGRGAPVQAVGEALERNPYVIASPVDAPILAQQIADTLTHFRAEGVLSELEKAWFSP